MNAYLKKIILCFIAISYLSISYSQNENSFEITGNFKGMDDGGKVTLVLFNSKAYHDYTKYLTYPDSTFIKNGEFHLKGIVPEGPRRYQLWIDFDKNGNRRIIELWIANGENIRLTADQPLNKINHVYIDHYVTITGSPTTESKMRLDPLYEFWVQAVEGGLNNGIKKVQDSTGFNPQVIGALLSVRDYFNMLLHGLIFSPDDYLDPDRKRAQMFFLGLYNNTGHASFWADVYKNLSEPEKNSFNGKWLQSLIPITVNQPFPEFKLLASDGKLLSSKGVIAKSKITIVHFWSANSVDRKKYQDEVRAMYKKYHDKGLNVISVFHDDTNYDNLKAYTKIDVKKQYEDILNAEIFPWYNVADWDYKNGPVETIYREGGGNNTTNVIINSEGKIIAWEVKGAELQYYLWKAFGE